MRELSEWNESFKIRQFEVNTDGFALLSTLANAMQESAGAHADSLGWSMQALLDQNMGWILNRFMLDIKRYPKAGEMVHIETWPSGADRLFAYRDFELFDDNHELVLTARTAWLILDIARRRPIPTPPDVVEIGAQSKRSARIEVEGKIARPDGEPVSSLRFPVRRADLDINQHLNNVRYMEWVLETLYEDNHAPKPGYFDIQFKAEGLYGDVAVSERFDLGNTESLHRIVRESDGKELAAAFVRR
jgi:acyl-ACP thioesterase